MSDIRQFPFPPFVLPAPSSFCVISPPFHSLPLQLLTGLLSDHLPAFIFFRSGPAFGLQAVVDLILVDSEKPAFSPFKTNKRNRVQVMERGNFKESNDEQA
jgi:hypothetical protein